MQPTREDWRHAGIMHQQPALEAPPQGVLLPAHAAQAYPDPAILHEDGRTVLQRSLQRHGAKALRLRRRCDQPSKIPDEDTIDALLRHDNLAVHSRGLNLQQLRERLRNHLETRTLRHDLRVDGYQGTNP